MDAEHTHQVIKLQELGRKKQIKGTGFSQRQIVRKLATDYISKKLEDVYCCMDTGLKERLSSRHNQFFMSFLHAYNVHGDILLVPDDIWLAILLFLSKYIDENAEKLRQTFVKHEGKK